MYTYRAKTVRVIDGDTVDVMIDLGFHTYMQERVRLAYVDTPEIFGPNATDAGHDAKAAVQSWFDEADMIGEWPLVLVSTKYDQRGKYGRVLAEIFRIGDPVSLNTMLIGRGWGSP